MIKKNLFILDKLLRCQDHSARRPFKGRIDYLTIWNHSLEEGQVQTIYKNLPMGVLEQFEGYTTPHCLEGVYGAKHLHITK